MKCILIDELAKSNINWRVLAPLACYGKNFITQALLEVCISYFLFSFVSSPKCGSCVILDNHGRKILLHCSNSLCTILYITNGTTPPYSSLLKFPLKKNRTIRIKFSGSQFILNDATRGVRLLSNLSTNWKFIAKYWKYRTLFLIQKRNILKN